MPNLVKIYNPKDHVFVFGSVIVEGFAEDSFIKFTPNADNTEDSSGVDGEVVISQTTDRRGTFEITLQATSKSNDELSIYDNLARNAPRMVGAIHPVTLKNLNGASVISGPNAWVMKTPEKTLGKTVGTTVWTIRVAHYEKADGGNIA